MERLTGLDATFLYLETPTHHMHVPMAMVLDPSTMPGGYSFEDIKRFIASRMDRIPQFRRRLVTVPLNLHHPVWVEDPEFDIDYHVRRIGAPAPGGRRELGEMAAQIASVPLDRSRPLWEMWVVEGLKQDRIGLVSKVHHCAIDGASGAELMVHLFDLDPAAAVVDGPLPDLPSEHIPNDIELLGHAVTSKVRRTMGLAPLLNQTARSVSRVVQGRRDPAGPGRRRAPHRPPGAVERAHVRPARRGLRPPPAGHGQGPQDRPRLHRERRGPGPVRRHPAPATSRTTTPSRPSPSWPSARCRCAPRSDAAGSNKVSALFTSLATQLDDPVERLDPSRPPPRGPRRSTTPSAPPCSRTGPSSPGPTCSTWRRASTRA